MTTPAFPFARSPDTAATDAVLIEALHACARRHVPALRSIYDLTAPRLLGELTQMLGDRHMAEAMLEDCYVHVWQLAGTYNPERCRPGTWLLSIARHHAIDSLREQPLLTPADEVDASLRLTDAALTEEIASPEQRVLQLAYLSGRSPAEIARALEWPLRRVQAAIRQGLRAMQGAPAP
jgi:RNA polymerase sigma-70 factor (ECF subfamily)